MNDLVSRCYPDAAFAYNRTTRAATFFEGPLAPYLSELLANRNQVLPGAMLAQFAPTAYDDMANDWQAMQEAVDHVLCVGSSSTKMEDVSDAEPNPWQDLGHYAARTWTPITASWELTYQCNQRCRVCYLQRHTDRGPSSGQVVAIAEQLYAAGVVTVMCTGGELFLRPDALEILELLEDRNFVLEAKTNGTVLNRELAQRIARLHLSDLQVSIYEIGDGMSDHTRSNYPFTTVAQNIGLLLEYGVPVTASVLVGRHNIDQVRQIDKVLADIGVDVFYTPYITPNRGGVGQELEYRLNRQEMDELFRPFLLEIDALPKLQHYRDGGTDSSVCLAGRDQIAIDPNGVVYPCLDLRQPLGDLTKEPLPVILDRRQALMSKFSLTEMPKCLVCPERDQCDSCVGLALIEHGDWRQPSQHKCDTILCYSNQGRR